MSAVHDLQALRSSSHSALVEASPIRQDWPEPRPIKAELPPAPAFDGETLLPKALADFVMDEADRMPCSPDYIAAALMVCLGSVIGARCAVKPKHQDDWIVTPNLFGGGIGDPSEKKTPSFNVATRYLDRLEAKETEGHEEEMRQHAADMAMYEARHSAVKASMKQATGSKPDAEKMRAAVEEMKCLVEPEEPSPRRFKSNDATHEKLGDILSRNPAGILVFRDELVGLLASWDKDGNEGARAFYLEGFNGTGTFNIDRIGRGSLFIPNLCLSVFGGIQPDLMAKYLMGVTSSMDNDGRVQRFLMLVYPEPVPWEWRDRRPVEGAREEVRRIFDTLANMDPVEWGAEPSDDFVKLPHFHFDPEAQELFIEWSTDLHRERIATETNPLMQQHFGKYEKLFCSVALILHLAEGRNGPIQADTAARAAGWCQYLEGHARRVYGLVETARVSTAAMLGRRLAEGKLEDGFTARDVSRKGWAGLANSMDADSALAILEERGWVRAYEQDAAPGRPTTRYIINPAVRRGQR